MWKASAGHSVNVAPPVTDDDDWDTDPNFVNDVSEKEQRWGSKSVEGSGKTAVDAKMDDIRSKVIEKHETVTRKEYESKGTFAHGYGGKFGVQTDRMDKSAVGFDDMTAPKPAAPSYQKPEVSKKDIRSKFESQASSNDEAARVERERAARAAKEKEERERAKEEEARRQAEDQERQRKEDEENERQRREEEERAAAAAEPEPQQESYEQPQETYEQPQETYEQTYDEQPQETYQDDQQAYEEQPVASYTATTMYDYEAAGEDELSFPEGVVIYNIEFIDEGWWRGEYDGKVGIFPANYVELSQ